MFRLFRCSPCEQARGMNSSWVLMPGTQQCRPFIYRPKLATCFHLMIASFLSFHFVSWPDISFHLLSLKATIMDPLLSPVWVVDELLPRSVQAQLFIWSAYTSGSQAQLIIRITWTALKSFQALPQMYWNWLSRVEKGISMFQIFPKCFWCSAMFGTCIGPPPGN